MDDDDEDNFEVDADPHEDLRDYAYSVVSSNPLRSILSGKRWSKERVEEVRARATNYEQYLSYFCRLVDFPSCYERKKKCFINCRCLKNLEYDQVQVVAAGIGEFFLFRLLIVVFIVTYPFFSFSSLCIARSSS
jgi:hypothetical protein